jgi:hypothetical protein
MLGEQLITSCSDINKLGRASTTENPSMEFIPVEIVTKDIIYKREKIGNSISGLPLFAITITGKDIPRRVRKRKGIFFTARVHPGEVNSSFVMQGIIKYLLGKTPQAKSLRDLYVFKIIPMLNPEGVASGNNRTNSAGADLNRRWNEPNEKLHPCIFHAKQTIADFKREREVLAFCDIHGHSKKKNAFIYGCNTAADGGFCSWTKVRLLPRIFAKRSECFSLKDCCFRVTPDKIGTARVTVWKEFKVTNSFTLEVSMWGYDYGDQVIQFTDKTLEQLGTDLLLSLLEYTYVWAELTQELVITNGWLKPSKLIEITGVPAKQVLAIRLKEEKEERRRIKRLKRLEEQKSEFTRKRKSRRRLYNRSEGHSTAQNEAMATSSPFSKRHQEKGIQNYSVTTKFARHSRDSPGRKSEQQSIDNMDTENPLTTTFTDESDGGDHASIEYNEHDMNVMRSIDLKEGGASIESGEMSFVDKIMKKKSSIRDVLPGVMEDWREYFNDEELNENYQMIEDGQDPNDLEEESADSDSEASNYGLEKEEYDQIFQEEPKSPQKKAFRVKPPAYVSPSKKEPEPQQPKSVDLYMTSGKLNASLDIKKAQLPQIQTKHSTPDRRLRNDAVNTSLHASLQAYIEKKNEFDFNLFRDVDSGYERRKKIYPKPLGAHRRSLQKDSNDLDDILIIKPTQDKINLPNINYFNHVNMASIEATQRERTEKFEKSDKVEKHDKQEKERRPSKKHGDKPPHVENPFNDAAFFEGGGVPLPKMLVEATIDKKDDHRIRVIHGGDFFRHKRGGGVELHHVKNNNHPEEILDQSYGGKGISNNVSGMNHHRGEKRNTELFATYKTKEPNLIVQSHGQTISNSHAHTDELKFPQMKTMTRYLEGPGGDGKFGGKVFSKLGKQMFARLKKPDNNINMLV